MAYDKPEQPPPCTPTRRPPSSGETPSFSSRARIFSAARSVRWIFAIVGLSVSVAMVYCPSTLVRGLFGHRHFDAVLLLPIADSRLDGVLSEHRAVNLYRRKRKLAHDIGILDAQRLFDGLALDPFGGQR